MSADTDKTPAAGAKAAQTGAERAQAVQDETVRIADAAMPGGRAALPAHTLREGPVQNQADEHRDQPLSPDGKPRNPDPPPLTGNS